jgi:amidohydrolase
MAQPDAFTITVNGKGGHGSMPHQTVDPIHAAAQIVVGAQSIISRNLDPLDPGVLSFGTIQGGTISNIIPENVTLTGTVRSFDPAVKKMIREKLEQMIDGTARAFGAEARLVYEDGYPPVVNPPEMTEFVRKTAERLFGADRVLAMRPVMGGEDFSYFLQSVPGAFFFFGAGDGCPYPHHHPSFDIDEKALPDAALLMTQIALDFLHTE